ncbi:Glucuronate isomerase-like protein [Pirellula staleyi DSM 6068]|uniref:Glucuronate isomerase-like protein n=1 Tax=Pirellula staleyi (strain ATCC 27377 / DSM 6068 / ICPB 4128) TaxID=530564 RepID=D2QWY0_PIRSD|nr:glucuronate isomerase [Pirellula staleyi]ADB16084.1 Glucuronate isomerase-like protein [Pirellula staleyi DSM 6068]
MSQELRKRLFDQLDSLVLIDPHTHIEATNPASHTLADILGYHYYTELAHSAGLARERIEDPLITAKEKVQLLIENLGPIENTIQWSWFIELSQKLFGHEADFVDASNWETLYDSAESQMGAPGYIDTVLEKSKLEAVFLTNDFDDALEGFDTTKYIPCLRTDDLVFHLAKPAVRERLEKATQCSVTNVSTLRQAIATLFYNFKSKNARACAISLPPDFSPAPVSEGRARTAIDAILKDGTAAAEAHRKAASSFVFWTLADMCAQYKLPFDLMIGVNRAVYPAGVHQGRDLYDSRVSLIQYKELFNSFPQVKFPVSVLASVTNQELVSYAWIFPNVITSGHWWYSNTPTYIEHDLSARLEAVPRTKQIGYYSDMYKLEFGLPKFAMYKRCLAKVLAERYVIDRGWSEERAVALGTQLLRGNVEDIFRFGEDPAADLEGIDPPWNDKSLVNPSLQPPELLVVQPPQDESDFPIAPLAAGAAIATTGAAWGAASFTGEPVMTPPADDGEGFALLPDDDVPVEQAGGIGNFGIPAADQPSVDEQNWFNTPAESNEPFSLTPSSEEFPALDSVEAVPETPLEEVQEAEFKLDDFTTEEPVAELPPQELMAEEFGATEMSIEEAPAEASPWNLDSSSDEASRATQPFSFGDFTKSDEVELTPAELGAELSSEELAPAEETLELTEMQLGDEPLMEAVEEEVPLAADDMQFGMLETVEEAEAPAPEPPATETPVDDEPLMLEAFEEPEVELEITEEPAEELTLEDMNLEPADDGEISFENLDDDSKSKNAGSSGGMFDFLGNDDK